MIWLKITQEIFKFYETFLSNYLIQNGSWDTLRFTSMSEPQRDDSAIRIYYEP